MKVFFVTVDSSLLEGAIVVTGETLEAAQHTVAEAIGYEIVFSSHSAPTFNEIVLVEGAPDLWMRLREKKT